MGRKWIWEGVVDVRIEIKGEAIWFDDGCCCWVVFGVGLTGGLKSQRHDCRAIVIVVAAVVGIIVE